ncbi:hypothetical protein KUV65_05115 [Maritalea mobilis]|uniref:hypothetical protein n=1 Tax=Maritalea mobilis TaxID=483324 RepID=UPI001C93D5D1|nr:hypothetical protein [Maritalea mobilis]MBY6200732.1 hypothetical protein [Maritalea mobilis]
MALIGLNVDGTGIEGTEAIWPALDALPEGRAVTVMTHGYRYSPRSPETDPHTHILSLRPSRPCWKAVSWPRHLHLHRAGADLGLALGWHATGALPRVALRASRVGGILGGLIGEIHARHPDLRINLVAHSLGARVALAAIADAPAGSVSRAILLSGAEYRSAARAAMAAPAGRGAQVLNVTSGENLPFDAMFRVAAPPLWPADRALCAGLPGLPGWTDLRIDCADTRAALSAMGYRTRPPVTRVCHWSGYLRPGLFPLYRDVLGPNGAETLARIATRTGAARRAPDPVSLDKAMVRA